MLKEELKHIDQAPKTLKKFGITMGIVVIIIGVLLFIYHKNSAPYFLGVGFSLILLGVLAPKLLKYPNIIWMSFALILGWFMTRVILSILFYLCVTPIGIVLRIIGKDFLGLKKRKVDSYWEKRILDKNEKNNYERQF